MKNVLVFGSNGYVARHFQSRNQERYNVIGMNRQDFDFLKDTGSEMQLKLRSNGVDAVVFLQGLNPKNGVDSITEDQFFDMLKVNIFSPIDIIRSITPWIKDGASIVFMSSIAGKKGSYDPSYAVAKSGIEGMKQTMANKYPFLRFNSVSLGLVENSPVHVGMTADFVDKHKDRMNGRLVDVDDACMAIEFLIDCESVNRQNIAVDRGYRV